MMGLIYSLRIIKVRQITSKGKIRISKIQLILIKGSSNSLDHQGKVNQGSLTTIKLLVLNELIQDNGKDAIKYLGNLFSNGKTKWKKYTPNLRKMARNVLIPRKSENKTKLLSEIFETCNLDSKINRKICSKLSTASTKPKTNTIINSEYSLFSH